VALGEEIGEAYVTVRYDTHSLAKDAEKAAAIGANAFWDEFEKRSGKKLETIFERVGEDAEHHMATSGDNAGNRWRRGFIGRLRGSRNDFLNIVGIIGGTIENGIGKSFDLLFKGIGGGLSSLGEKLTSFSGGSGPLGALGSGLSTVGDSVKGLAGKGGLIGLAISAGIAFVSFEAFLAVLGPLVAGVSALLGVVTALASALGFALAGALLSLGPIIGSVLAGFIGIQQYLTYISDASGKMNGLKLFNTYLSEFDDKLVEILPSFKELGDLFADFFKGIDQFIPLLGGAAQAVLDWGHSFSKALQGPDMQKNLGVFEDTWPGILTNLLDTFTSLFVGISGIMRAISPDVLEVTGRISDGAKAFSDWANSAKGQSSLKSFFDKATKAAGSLWGIIKNVAVIIGEIFGAGEDTGKGFLDNLRDMTDQWAKFLGTKEGQAALKQWFSDAKDLASSLKNVISELVDFLDQLDTPENRKTFSNMVGWIKGVIQALEWLESVATYFTTGWLEDFGQAEMAVIDWFNGVVGWFEALPGKINEALLSVGQTISGWVGSAGETLGRLWDGLMAGLSGAWNNVISFWTGTVMGWFNSITAPFREFWSSFWSHLWSHISPEWDKVVSWWNKTVVPWFTSKIIWVGVKFSEFWGHLTDGLSAGWAKVTSWWNKTVVPWFNARVTWVKDKWNAFWGTINNGLSAGWSKVTSWWNSTVGKWFSDRKTQAGNAFTSVWTHLGDGLSAGWKKVTGWWNDTAYPWLRSLPSKAGGIGGDIVGTILDGIINSFYKIPQWIGQQLSSLHFSIPTPSFHIPGFASGGMVNGATHALVGEAGPEAIVPLNRNLNQVDPSVRWLSAIAQGKTPAMASGGVAGGGVTIEQGAIQVVTPYANPALVAEDVMDALAVRFR